MGEVNPALLINAALQHDRRKTQTLNPNHDSTQDIKQNVFTAHGEVSFKGVDDPNIANFLLKNKWKLKPPTLIVSVYGSDIDLSKRLTTTMKKGLWKAAESAGCWIICDALQAGIASVASEAVRDYSEAYGGDHMLAIGVSPSERLQHYDLFQRNLSVVDFPPYDPDDETLAKGKVPRSTSGFPLHDPPKTGVDMDTSHKLRLCQNTNFVLMMERSSTATSEEYAEMYINSRAMLERCVASWRRRDEPDALAEQTLEHSYSRRPTVAPTVPPIPTINEPSVEASRKVSDAPSGMLLEPQPSSDRSRRGSILLPSRNLDCSLLPPDSELYGSHRSSFAATGGELGGTGASVETSNRVPICGLLAGGDRLAIHQVYLALKLNKCPVVVIRGTQGAADIIAAVQDFLQLAANVDLEHSFEESEINHKVASLIREGWEAGDQRVIAAQQGTKAGGQSTVANNEEAQQPQQQQQQQADINVDDYAEEVMKLREICEKYAHLLSYFDSEEGDMDGYLISALLSSAGMDTPSDRLNLEQLEIAIRLNRADIARDKIFLDGKGWRRNALDKFMVQVILNDQDDFVNLLIDQGFRLEDFLSVHTLEDLYTECLKRIDSKTELVTEMWMSKRVYKMDWVMLRDIARIIRNLVGDFYEPLYESKEFIAQVVQRGYDPHVSSDDGSTESDSDFSLWSSKSESSRQTSDQAKEAHEKRSKSLIPISQIPESRNLVSLAQGDQLDDDGDLGSLNSSSDDTIIELPATKLNATLRSSTSTRVPLHTTRGVRHRREVAATDQQKSEKTAEQKRSDSPKEQKELDVTNENQRSGVLDSSTLIQTESSLQTFNEMRYQIQARMKVTKEVDKQRIKALHQQSLLETSMSAEQLWASIDQKKLNAAKSSKRGAATSGPLRPISARELKRIERQNKKREKRMKKKLKERACRRRWAKGELTLLERFTGASRRMREFFSRALLYTVEKTLDQHK